MLLRPQSGAHTDDPSSAAGADIFQGCLCFHTVLTCTASCSSLWERHLSLMNVKVQYKEGNYLGLSTFPRGEPASQEALRLSMVAHINYVKLEFTTEKHRPITITLNLLPCLYSKADSCVACVHILLNLLCSWCCCHLFTAIKYFD